MNLKRRGCFYHAVCNSYSAHPAIICPDRRLRLFSLFEFRIGKSNFPNELCRNRKKSRSEDHVLEGRTVAQGVPRAGFEHAIGYLIGGRLRRGRETARATVTVKFETGPW